MLFTATVIIGTAGKAVDRVEQRVEMMSDDKKRYATGRDMRQI